MPASDQVLPQRLVAIRRSFEHWRRQRTVGSRIPEQLWKAAVEAAGEFGIHPTAKALSLDYYPLKRRLETSSADSSLCDAASKGLTADERLRLHQARSGPVMQHLRQGSNVSSTSVKWNPTRRSAQPFRTCSNTGRS